MGAAKKYTFISAIMLNKEMRKVRKKVKSNHRTVWRKKRQRSVINQEQKIRETIGAGRIQMKSKNQLKLGSARDGYKQTDVVGGKERQIVESKDRP